MHAHSSWIDTFRSFLHPRVITLLVYGFSAGLPYALIFGTLSLWLKEAGTARDAITYFSWAGLGYSFKFVWAPMVDTLPLPILKPFLGRRRSWLLLAQISITAVIITMALTDPAQTLDYMAVFAVLLGFSSATQDICIDAYRIESAHKDLQALMSSAYIAGYRIGLIVSGAGALYMAGQFGSTETHYHYHAWQTTYLIMASMMSLGIITTLLIKEPERSGSLSTYDQPSTDYIRLFILFLLCVTAFICVFYFSADWAQTIKHTWKELYSQETISKGDLRMRYTALAALRLIGALSAAIAVGFIGANIGIANKALVKQSYISPITDFFARYGVVTALIIFAFIMLYRISDIVMGSVANLFYTDIGFTKENIAAASKTFGLAMTILGSFLGGILSVRFGVVRVLWLGALLSAVTNVLFAWLAHAGHANLWALYGVITADNLSAGLATAAFIAFLSALTNIQFTAVQYALLSSIMTLFPKLLSGYSGAISLEIGYAPFFILTALIGLPVLVLIEIMRRRFDFERE